MNKKTILITLGVISIFIVICSCKYCKYKSALDKQAKEWYQTHYINKEIKGKLKTINLFEDDPYKVILTIDDSSEFDLTYGVTCVDQSFNDFVTTGDSVFKASGSKSLSFYKTDKRLESFELNFCGKINSDNK